jgi:Protein of unknown function (DUF2934)
MNIHHEQIQERAYALWVEEGCVHGRAEDYWFRAERELNYAVDAAPVETIKTETKAKKVPVKRRASGKRAA